MAAQTTYRITFEPGEQIFAEGDSGDYAYIIQQGHVELSIHANDDRVILATLSKGEIFGEMALVDSKPRTASASAMDRVELLGIHRDYVEQKLAQTDPLVACFVRVILERYRNTLSHSLPTPAPSPHALYLHDLDLTTHRVEVDVGLREALVSGYLVLFYQPIIDLQTRQLAGCEALLRWRHPERGLIMPANFIEIAEDTGLILPIGEWILSRACQDLIQFNHIRHSLHKETHQAPLYMSVNLSGRQFEQPHLVDRIEEIVRSAGVSPRRIKLEVTESLLISNPAAAAEVLKGFKERGFSIAIDDFGTGYSSFSYLHRYPIDTLKIDRAFVSSMLEDKRSAKIVHALVSMASSLDMSVIAEGIEKTEEMALLHQYGAHFGQGFLFSKPLSYEGFSALLHQPLVPES